MVKIGIFLDNLKVASLDCQHIGMGNPGMSGTPYMISIVSYLLSVRDNGIDVVVLTPYEYSFPDVVKTQLVSNLYDAYNVCKIQHIDYLLFKHQEMYSADEKRMFFEDSSVRLLIWCHNFVNSKLMRMYQRSNNVSRVISVGREQMDLYRDHKAFQKSDYIYNCIDLPHFTEHTYSPLPYNKRKNVVTYMGAVIPGKGFHILAKAWKDVLKEVPDAELYVIGSAALYCGGEKNLGDFKLAERRYENMFMKYLTAEDGTLLPSVHLMGVMGKEKLDILKQTKVGVPNPSGLTETFCICALEMQMAGARIASVECAGYLDTVKNGTLYKGRKQLAKHIVRELRTTQNDYPAVVEFVNKHFSQEAVVRDWELLLTDSIPNGTYLHPIQPLSHPRFKLKWLKEHLRVIKTRVPLLSTLLPSVETLLTLWDKIDYKLFKLTNGFPRL